MMKQELLDPQGQDIQGPFLGEDTMPQYELLDTNNTVNPAALSTTPPSSPSEVPNAFIHHNADAEDDAPSGSTTHPPFKQENEHQVLPVTDSDESDGDSKQPQNKKRPLNSIYTLDPETGKRKINIEYIGDKSKRHITFSKRKAGIMKKAFELSILTGTEVLLLVASETGHVYTFATPKLQPMITKPEGKSMIQQCLSGSSSDCSSPPQSESNRFKEIAPSQNVASSQTTENVVTPSHVQQVQQAQMQAQQIQQAQIQMQQAQAKIKAQQQALHLQQARYSDVSPYQQQQQRQQQQPYHLNQQQQVRKQQYQHTTQSVPLISPYATHWSSNHVEMHVPNITPANSPEVGTGTRVHEEMGYRVPTGTSQYPQHLWHPLGKVGLPANAINNMNNAVNWEEQDLESASVVGNSASQSTNLPLNSSLCDPTSLATSPSHMPSSNNMPLHTFSSPSSLMNMQSYMMGGMVDTQSIPDMNVNVNVNVGALNGEMLNNRLPNDN